ncbi:uncharacterized protein LOC112343697 isoform X1 [Selaginella moellendorffii]|uniref:uncharacterized protein LOC112343697 isoform X1 n=1 Tax=Selaginella moellendorffii TaxID=88036 RepID=UPI000D1CCD3D|nr:uncharacterized protein LOC112343697 isoform X1 [Selaginella moellendorffii]|eukprot:XP_024523427.1 uncharacterized protein LOC112343697 isoform X1 [Selaginella moellendorffii]
MEEAECCVCLQGFEEEGEHVPRVLRCGHTLCQECVVHLARDRQQQQQQRFVRCPECSHVTALAYPSSLPKNFELLRLSGRSRRPRPATVAPSSLSVEGAGQFVLRDLLHPFPGLVSICVSSSSDSSSSGDLLHGQLGDGLRVSLFLLLGSSRKWRSILAGKDDLRREEAAMKLWQQGLSQGSRKEILALLRVASLCQAACKVVGVWLNDEHSKLYLVNNISFGSTSLSAHHVQGGRLADAAADLCEILMQIHSQGMVLGIFGMEMFQVSQFGRIIMHWNGALELRGAMHRSLVDDKTTREAWHFTSPEMLVALSSGAGTLESENQESSDVWSLACFLLHLILDRPCPALSFKQACDEVKQKRTLLGAAGHGDSPFQEFLLSCLAEHPDERPTMKEFCHHLKLLRSPETSVTNDEEDAPPAQISWCFGLQALDMLMKEEVFQDQEQQDLQLEETTTLEGHTGCITSLAFCGANLVSVSFDKTVRLWSLQDESLLWSWEDQHPQRIQALAVDEASQVCYTGDYGRLICVWKLSQPFQKHPVAKWQDHNDWRFTGVASLVISDDGVLYSGSGDMLVKAWCTETHSLLGTFCGHRGVVSTLAVGGGLLYSGSWDGCIRIWSRSDFGSVGVLNVGTDPIRALSISSDDEAVVCGLDNGGIQVWKNGKCDASIRPHDGPISCLATISTDGCLCTGGWDKSIKVVHVNDDDVKKSITCDDAVMSMVYKGNKLYAALGKNIKVYK